MFAAALGYASPSHAAVSVFFSSTPDCLGTAAANFSSGGPTVPMSLCMTTTTPTKTCGHTIILQAAVGEGGRFFALGTSSLGPNYADGNTVPPPYPLSIDNPPVTADLGGTITGSAAIASAANQRLATFDLSPQSGATNSTYAISLNSASIVAVDAGDDTCGGTTVPTEAPISASFTLTRTNAPVFTSPASVTFTTGGNNSFTPTAIGSPTPTITQSGVLPSGITFTGGALQGTPATAGVFNITFTATNVSGSVMQSFQLTTSAGSTATQTISFTGPNTQPFSPAPITLSATASSGLPVTLSSNTQSICSVVGTTLTMITAGSCTIAANQAGGSGYAVAATVLWTFGITGGIPGAPTIGTPTAGDGQATVAFTAPTSSGGSAIISYTASCAVSGNSPVTRSGNSSPITVTGLTNGALYQCSVTATNANGTGPTSASAGVTPAAGPVTLVGVQSRKIHNTAGTFDIPINFGVALAGLVSVEPRSIGAGHTIVFQFTGPITSAGTVSVVDAVPVAVGSAMTSFSGNEITVTLTGVPNNKRVTISLANVNGAGIGASASIGFLVGDVNNTRTVTSLDILQVKAKSGQATDITNFVYDLNTSGGVSSTDILQVKASSGLSIP